jgi:hypothetical protein
VVEEALVVVENTPLMLDKDLFLGNGEGEEGH